MPAGGASVTSPAAAPAAAAAAAPAAGNTIFLNKFSGYN